MLCNAHQADCASAIFAGERVTFRRTGITTPTTLVSRTSASAGRRALAEKAVSYHDYLRYRGHSSSVIIDLRQERSVETHVVQFPGYSIRADRKSRPSRCCSSSSLGVSQVPLTSAIATRHDCCTDC